MSRSWIHGYTKICPLDHWMDPEDPDLRYNATISACSWHLAVALLRSLRTDASLRPNVLTYGGSVSAAETTE